MRLIAFILSFRQIIVPVAFGLGFVIFGVIMFVKIGNSERRLQSEMENVSAGKVKPEMLTVLRKYLNTDRHGISYPHVVFRASRQPKVDRSVPVDFYNATSLGGTVEGYYFPEGYYIPQIQTKDAGIAKWIFLGFGILSGAGMMTAAVVRAKMRPPNANGDLGTLEAAIRDRGGR